MTPSRQNIANRRKAEEKKKGTLTLSNITVSAVSTVRALQICLYNITEQRIVLPAAFQLFENPWRILVHSYLDFTA